jgi:hypothetical protein
MPNPDQIDIRQQKRPGVWTLEFEFNQEFIDYLKGRVPSSERSYDKETHIWTLWCGTAAMNAVEGVAVQKFRYAVKYFRNADDELVMKNLKTGAESVQKGLF